MPTPVHENEPAAAGVHETGPQSAATAPPPSRNALEFIWGAVATGLALLYTAVLASVAALASLAGRHHFVSWISRLWARMILFTCGIGVDVDGLENIRGLRSFVLVCNHQSLFDILAILASMPAETRFVAKQELRKIPLIGFIMHNSGHVLIDRTRGGQSIRRALASARHGYAIIVFAEGTRFSDNRVHPFNDGAAWLGIATRLKCVPAAMSGGARFFPRGARIVCPGRRMRIVIGQPIDTAQLRSADREKLTRDLETAVRALLSGK